jgi:hypothetical protein
MPTHFVAAPLNAEATICCTSADPPLAAVAVCNIPIKIVNGALWQKKANQTIKKRHKGTIALIQAASRPTKLAHRLCNGLTHKGPVHIIVPRGGRRLHQFPIGLVSRIKAIALGNNIIFSIMLGRVTCHWHPKCHEMDVTLSTKRQKVRESCFNMCLH